MLGSQSGPVPQRPTTHHPLPTPRHPPPTQRPQATDRFFALRRNSMTLALRLGRGETPGWIYSPATPGFFFTGGYCCKLATAKFTVLGGVRQGAIPIANAEQFSEETWSVLTPVPSPARSQAAGASYRGAGLHIGGTFTSPPYFSSQVDRLWQGTWNVETSLPAPRYAHAAASVGDAVYVVGGRDEQQQTVDTLFEYRDGTWTTKTPQPGGGRAFGNAVGLNDDLCSVCGKSADDAPTDTCSQYSPKLTTWQARPALITGARFGAGGFSLQSSFIIVGGNQGFGQLATQAVKFSATGWEVAPTPIGVPRYYLTSNSDKESGHITGGITSIGTATASHESLDTGTWRTRTSCPPPNRWHHTSTFS